MRLKSEVQKLGVPRSEFRCSALLRRQWADLDIAIVGFVGVVREEDMAAEFGAEPGDILEFALGHRGEDGGAAEFVFEGFDAVQPMLDVLALDEDARLIPVVDFWGWFVGCGGRTP